MRSRWVLILLAVGVTLDLLISAALVYQARQIEANASTTHILRLAQYEACVRNNAQNEADLVRWEKVLSLVDTMPTNPQTVAFIDGVREANRTADKQVDCGVPVH